MKYCAFQLTFRTIFKQEPKLESEAGWRGVGEGGGGGW